MPVDCKSTTVHNVEKECTELGTAFAVFATTVEEWILSAAGVGQPEKTPYRGRGGYPQLKSFPVVTAVAPGLGALSGPTLT